MKRLVKSVLGVTLLEIMLVLAIAAMVIVMSVRYYQSANAGQQANALVSQLSTIVAAADSLAQGTGSYVGTVSSTAITNIIGTNGLNTPWGGGAITIGVQASYLMLTVPFMPPAVCNLMKAKLSSNAHFSASASVGTPFTCSSTAATINVYYIANA